MEKTDYTYQKQMANEAFQIFFPQIIQKLDDADGKIILSEKSDNEVCKILDNVAGIDAIYLHCGRIAVETLALRGMNALKKDGTPSKFLDSFTIRYNGFYGRDVEFKKRIYAIQNNYLYPKYTVQIFVDNLEIPTKIISGAIIQTQELYEHILHGKLSIADENISALSVYSAKAESCEGGNTMIAIPFSNVDCVRIV